MFSKFDTQGIEFIREECDWDTYDVWASLRSLQFDIAEAWYGYAEECLPRYRPSPSFQDNDWESERSGRLYGAMMDAIIRRDDIEYWWSVLDRMEDLTRSGWAQVNELLSDIREACPLTLLNPTNLPVLS